MNYKNELWKKKKGFVEISTAVQRIKKLHLVTLFFNYHLLNGILFSFVSKAEKINREDMNYYESR